jgi:hypothetical protein
MRSRAFIVVFALCGFLLPLPGAAGQAPTEREDPPAQGISNPELIRMLDTYALVQAQDALQLSDPQYGQFVTRLKKLQETRRTNTQRRHRILQQLRALTARGAVADERAIREQLDALHAHDAAAADQMRRAYQSLDEVLDARQQARFRLFEEQMERRKLDLLMRARDRAGTRRGRS